MKRAFKYYLTAWVLAVMLFNLVVFAIPLGRTSYDGAFWFGYGFITLLLVLQAVCTFIYTQKETATARFLRLPIVTVSYGALVSGIAIGAFCMKAPFVPAWLAAVLCAVVTAVEIFAILQAMAATEHIEAIDKKIKVKTFFIKSLTADTEALLAMATPETAPVLRRVAEAVRYSDPMSCDALTDTEAQISIRFEQLSAAVNGKDADRVNAVAEEMLALLKSRNAKCKILK